MDLELDPLGQAGGGGEAGEAHGFLGVHRAAGVGQEQVFLRIDEFEDVGEGIVFAGQVRAAQGDGDDLVPLAASASRMASFEGNLPVPSKSRELNSRPAMVRVDMEEVERI